MHARAAPPAAAQPPAACFTFVLDAVVLNVTVAVGGVPLAATVIDPVVPSEHVG
jgi:hypothetical protein